MKHTSSIERISRPGLTVSVPLLHVWVHCPRASNVLLPGRSNLVGYVQWDARFDQVLLVKQSFPTALQVAILESRFRTVRGRGDYTSIS